MTRAAKSPMVKRFTIARFNESEHLPMMKR
jgi:hypothetical protein